jgi:molecular chaperone GrpE (heat shock protein)
VPLQKKVAIQIVEYYQSKLSEDSIVLLPKEEYEKLQTDMRRLAYQNCNLTIENKNLKEDLDIEILKGKEAVEKFAKDLLAIWDDLEKWSEKYYEPHSGITPAHIKECIKQFRVDEIKE